MTDKVVEGVFAINKPHGISSAQCIRDLKTHFNPSSLFRPWLTAERRRIARESHNQRHRRRQKKIDVKLGHGGTLDPMATGVLIIGMGKGTKSLTRFLECTKTYETVVLFGAATDTYDTLGKVVNRTEYGHVTREKFQSALGKFRGEIMQTPPVYSALKVQGKKLYEYARNGWELPKEIEARPVKVLELELVEWLEGGSHEYKWPEQEADMEEKDLVNEVLQLPKGEPGSSPMSGEKRKLNAAGEGDDKRQDTETTPAKRAKVPGREEDGHPVPTTLPEAKSSAREGQQTSAGERPPAARLRMTTTSGFYVRSFCHDLGRELDTFAMMAALIRRRQGEFELGKNVLEYEELEKGEGIWGPRVEGFLDIWNQSNNGNDKDD